MSINAKLKTLSLDLHSVSQQSSPMPRSNKSTPSQSKPKSKSTKDPVAESWEDESLSGSDREQMSPKSDSSTPLEAPGPNIKSPQTRAKDAERELAGEDPTDMPTPPPTPISPAMSGVKADWSPATTLGGGRPIYTYPTASDYTNSNPSSSARSTPTGGMTPTHLQPHRYPTPNPPVDSTSRDREAEKDKDRKRPEKTTATANRLIAGALGIRAPPKTDEQRHYDRAVKEQEMKRRNKEKEERKKAEEEDEKAKAAIWES